MAGSTDKAAIQERIRQIQIRKMSHIPESELSALNQELADLQRRLAMLGSFEGAF